MASYHRIICVNTCRFCTKHSKKHSLVKSCFIKIRDLNYCGTNNVIYAVECTFCKLQYIGCTMLPLKTCISEHYQGASYTNEKGLSNVSKHFKYVHSGDMSAFVFYGLEKIKIPLSAGGGDIHTDS